jgi:hypothetical protein
LTEAEIDLAAALADPVADVVPEADLQSAAMSVPVADADVAQVPVVPSADFKIVAGNDEGLVAALVALATPAGQSEPRLRARRNYSPVDPSEATRSIPGWAAPVVEPSDSADALPLAGPDSLTGQLPDTIPEIKPVAPDEAMHEIAAGMTLGVEELPVIQPFVAKSRRKSKAAAPEAGWADRAEAEIHRQLSDGVGAAATVSGPEDVPSPATYSAPLAPDVVLRDLVREMIQEQLQGRLGEQITLNLRNLVRTEVMRTMGTEIAEFRSSRKDVAEL